MVDNVSAEDTMAQAPSSTPSRQHRLLWRVVAMSVAGTLVAGAFTGVGSPIAVAVGVLAALGTVGWSMWKTAPDPEQAKSQLGTGLLVSIVVAAAVGSAQLAIDDRRRVIELERQAVAQRAADTQNLRTTVGLQRNLEGIDLSGRNLTKFYFANKNLGQARLERATLVSANFERANLRNAELASADLRQAKLFEADLRGTNLQGADLGDAQVTGAKLSAANLRRAHLRGTKLDGTCLRRAFLDGADLRDADLRAADLRRADLRSADLRGADLHVADLRGARVDSNTRWPAGYRRGSGAAVDLEACQPRRGSRP